MQTRAGPAALAHRAAPLLCAACGAGVGLCFLYPALSLLAWVLPAPAFYLLLRAQRPRAVLGRAAAYSFALCAAAYLPAYTVRVMDAPLADLGVDLALHLAATLLHGTMGAAALALGARLPCPQWARPLSLALCLAGGEWLGGVGPIAWPVARLGLTQWNAPLLIQAAALGGSLLVSALMAAFSGYLALAALAAGRGRAALLAVAALLLGGNAALGLLRPAPPAGETPVALVQHWPAGQDLAARQALAWQAAQTDPALIFLPESSLAEPAAAALFAPAAQAGGCGVVAGAKRLLAWDAEAPAAPPVEAASLTQEQRQAVTAGGQPRFRLFWRACALALGPDGGQTDAVLKQRLVPFLENGRGAPFSLAQSGGGAVLQTPAGPVGVLICYESLFSGAARSLAGDGAVLLAVLTSDSSFQGGWAPAMHFGQGVFRALETGRWLVQAAAEGVTAAVGPTGRVTAALPPGESGVLAARVGLAPRAAPYLLWGDAWLAAALALLAVGCLCFHLRTGPPRRAKPNATPKGGKKYEHAP